VSKPFSFDRSRRLRLPGQFAAVQAAPRSRAIRRSGRWLALSAMWRGLPVPGQAVAGQAAAELGEAELGVAERREGEGMAERGEADKGKGAAEHGVELQGSLAKFGFTVGKRNARRSIDRNRVRRLLRESARHAARAVRQACAERGIGVDVVLRLKSPLPHPAPAAHGGWSEWKREVRAECDALLLALVARLREVPAEGAARGREC
jgi:hypothetical protein